ncbi:VWA domain-containing protein [Caldifermentibacillus hisashii]|uniref:vWA domain-containing protein n=1 Tax=Caldifermentibacillus hisashii TaxID=996558 RepID=UPI002E214A7F|nr:VWA domain-containing protein [Caldifermentibacillus hisashii]
MDKRFKKKVNIYKNPTINVDSFDKRRFNELMFMSKGLQRVKKEGEEIPFFDQLMGDVWSVLFKNNPQLIEEVPNELKNNQKIIKKVLNDEKYHETHEYTKLDDLYSCLCTVGFSEKIFNWIKKEIVSDPYIQLTHNDMKINEIQKGKDSQEFKKSMHKFMQALGESINNDDKSFSKMLQDSLTQAKDTESMLHELLSGIKAGVGGSELKNVPLRDQFTLAEYLSKHKKMKEIAEWAGRFKAIAKSKQKSKSKEAIARSGVKIGNEIDRLLPAELVNLSIPQAKNDFLRRFVENQTLQYGNTGKEKLGKGAIILCLDQSGSMENIDNQAKGFTLALMSIARKQRRDFGLILFSNDLMMFHYPKGKITVPQMVELCETFLNGGTNFRKPLDKTIELIKKERYKNADVVFVTDGEDNSGNTFFYEEYKRNKEKLGFSLVSLLIGKQTRSIKEFSNKIYFANDFEDENAHDVFSI